MNTMSKQRLNFELVQSHYCCGIYELGRFEQLPERDWNGTKRKAFKNNAAVLDNFKKDLCNYFNDFFNEAGFWTDDTTFLVTASLIAEYAANKNISQFPDLATWFVENGWTAGIRFKNPNSGNTVQQYYIQVDAAMAGVNLDEREDNYDPDDEEEIDF